MTDKPNLLWRLIISLVMVVALSGLARAGISPGGSHALVIGNNDYKNLPKLETAVNDASIVADVLRQNYGFEVELLLNATRYQIVSALNRMRRKLTAKDRLLVYYAGHGILDEDSDTGYWLPVDAEENSEANWIANGTISRNLKAMSARHVMVVADSCYSGALVRSVNAKLRTGSEREAWLARMDSKRSRTALVSGGLEPVSDGGGHGHSVFARQFIEALRTNTEILDGEGLYDRIKRQIVVKADQTPRYSDIRNADHDGGDFLFVPIGTQTASMAATAPVTRSPVASDFDTRQLELAFWMAIKGSTNVTDYREYLQRFPNGTFAGLASRQIERLGKTRSASLTATPAPTARPETFRDCKECPAMVSIPAGSFMMGPKGEDGEEHELGPQHRVTLARPFAAGKYEVTFAQWDACVADGGCNGYSPDDEGWGDDDRPVMNVSWHDAKSYVSWLSRKTGERYRLLSEAEWEYAARAGSTSPYWWGQEASNEYANYVNDASLVGRDIWESTSPIGTFPANKFGLYDVSGNVHEWVEDCGHDDYAGAPKDGSAWTSGGNCRMRIIRGGSWASAEDDLWSAHRDWDDAENRGAITGFRVARDIDR